MFKRLLAVIGTAALITGASLVVAPLTASAHNLGLDGVAVCQTDGTYTVTWTGTTHNVPAGDTGVAMIKSHTPPSSSLSASSVPGIVGNTSFTFTQSGIPGSTNQANVNLDIAWTGADEYKQNDVTGHVKLDGDCKAPTPKDAVATVTVIPPTCAAPGYVTFSGSNLVSNPTPDGSVGDHSLDVTAADGHLFADGTTTKTIKYTVAAQLHDLSCYPPVACTSAGGTYYAEDVPASQGQYGRHFVGQAQPVEWYHTVTGNLQGLGDQSVTFANVAGYQPSLTVVFYRNTSGPNTGYANLVAEWYMNGGSPSTDGTFHVNSSTLFWTNKIANPAAGSQSNPQPLSFFEALWPANSLISIGEHLGSGSTSATHSDVTAVTGCVSDNYVPTNPEPTTRSTTVTTDPVCSLTGGGTTTTTVTNFETPYVWNDDSHSYVPGTEVQTGQTVTTNIVPVGADCPIHAKLVDPTVPSVDCNVAPAAVLPADTEDISYALTASTSAGFTVTATPAENVVLDAATGWTIDSETGVGTYTGTFPAKVICILPPPVQKALATTGVPIFGGLAAAMLLLLIGSAVFVFRRKDSAPTE